MFSGNITFGDAFKLAVAFASTIVLLAVVAALLDVFLIFFTALILAVAMDKPIDKLGSRNVPRLISSVMLYASVLLSVFVMLYVIFPPLVSEIRSFTTTYPTYSEAILGDEAEEVASGLSSYLRPLSESLVGSSNAVMSTVFVTFGGFATFLAVFFIAFFLNTQQGGVWSLVDTFVPATRKQTAKGFFTRVQDKVSSWLWGKTLSSLLVGLLTFIGLTLLNIPYALVLAVFAIFLNFIPFIGPIVASIPAVLLGLTQSTLLGIGVALLYFLVNGILESFVFGPLLMRRAIKINPAFLIIFVISGAYLGGILGIIIAIPTAAIIYLAVNEYAAKRQGKAA